VRRGVRGEVGREKDEVSGVRVAGSVGGKRTVPAANDLATMVVAPSTWHLVARSGAFKFVDVTVREIVARDASSASPATEARVEEPSIGAPVAPKPRKPKQS